MRFPHTAYPSRYWSAAWTEPVRRRSPGFNDNDEFAHALGEFLKGYENVGYEALPYHRLGTQKYDFLSREYAMGDVSLPDGVAQRIQRIVDETRGAVPEEK